MVINLLSKAGIQDHALVKFVMPGGPQSDSKRDLDNAWLVPVGIWNHRVQDPILVEDEKNHQIADQKIQVEPVNQIQPIYPLDMGSKVLVYAWQHARANLIPNLQQQRMLASEVVRKNLISYSWNYAELLLNGCSRLHRSKTSGSAPHSRQRKQKLQSHWSIPPKRLGLEIPSGSGKQIDGTDCFNTNACNLKNYCGEITGESAEASYRKKLGSILMRKWSFFVSNITTFTDLTERTPRYDWAVDFANYQTTPGKALKLNLHPGGFSPGDPFWFKDHCFCLPRPGSWTPRPSKNYRDFEFCWFSGNIHHSATVFK